MIPNFLGCIASGLHIDMLLAPSVSLIILAQWFAIWSMVPITRSKNHDHTCLPILRSCFLRTCARTNTHTHIISLSLSLSPLNLPPSLSLSLSSLLSFTPSIPQPLHQIIHLFLPQRDGAVPILGQSQTYLSQNELVCEEFYFVPDVATPSLQTCDLILAFGIIRSSSGHAG